MGTWGRRQICKNLESPRCSAYPLQTGEFMEADERDRLVVAWTSTRSKVSRYFARTCDSLHQALPRNQDGRTLGKLVGQCRSLYILYDGHIPYFRTSRPSGKVTEVA